MLTRSGKIKECDVVPSEHAASDEDPPDSHESSQRPLSAVKRPLTRKRTDFWLIGHPSATLTGAKLPDCRQVMKYVLYLRHDPESVKNGVKNADIAHAVVDSVVIFWHMARIKTKTRQNCVLDVMSLWNVWNSLMKNKNRPNDPENRRATFTAKLDTLFDIGAPDAVNEIRNSRLLSAKKKQDDIDFYLDQQHERRATMNGHDKIFETKAEMLQARVDREHRLREREQSRVIETRSVDTLDESSDESADDYMETDPDFDSNESRRTIEFVSLQFPKNIMLCDEITSAADRLKLSDNQTTMIVSAVIKAAGGNLEDFDISRSTTRRSRMCNRQKIAENVMESVRQHPPRFGALHWDGKLLKDVLGDSHERLAVLLSGAPEYPEGKLLGVPALLNSKGQTQADATHDLLEAWDLLDNVVALVFDTTASNSGVHKGAAKLIEERLGRKLLYLACRHHILELVVGAVWKLLFGEILTPDNKLFAYFKAAWSDIDKQLPLNILKINNPWLLERRDHVVSELMTLLECKESSTFPRDDYRECAENALIILGQRPPRDIHFLKPGAIHQARWMACNVYAGKMFMFSRAMHYDADFIVKLERMNTFLALFHTPAWLKASIGSDAPVNDLQLVHDLIYFREIDQEVADVALEKLTNHRWYLSQEVVPFSLFSKHTSMTDSVKEEIAAALQATAMPDNFRLGKPLFQNIARDITLKSLIGPESHTLFAALNVNTCWLSKPVHLWPSDPDFVQAEQFVRHVKVVNDAAEIGVKLISDYATIITTDEEQRAWLMQGVEHHRKVYPAFDKSALNA
jgi:hypothetical protein